MNNHSLLPHNFLLHIGNLMLGQHSRYGHKEIPCALLTVRNGGREDSETVEVVHELEYKLTSWEFHGNDIRCLTQVARCDKKCVPAWRGWESYCIRSASSLAWSGTICGEMYCRDSPFRVTWDWTYESHSILKKSIEGYRNESWRHIPELEVASVLEKTRTFCVVKKINGNKTETAIKHARRVEAFVPRGPLAFSVVSVLHITSVETDKHMLQYHVGHLFWGFLHLLCLQSKKSESRSQR